MPQMFVLDATAMPQMFVLDAARRCGRAAANLLDAPRLALVNNDFYFKYTIRFVADS